MAKRDFSFPRIEGQVSRQAHVGIPNGHYEREIGREGFFGAATHMIHRHPPTAWAEWEGPLKPRAFYLTDLDTQGVNPWDTPVLLGNDAVKIRWWNLRSSMTNLVRNGDGDELFFVHTGSGDLFCDYGHLEFQPGDYLLVPRGCMWRIETDQGCSFLQIEATGGAYGLPDRGSLGPHAFFDPAKLEAPKINTRFRDQQSEEEWKVVIKRRESKSTVTFPHNPLDTIGWHGNVSVLRINWRDLRPITSHSYHLPPSAHTTFVANGFVVCTFVPRPLESDPEALKLPFFHNNDDFDEVLFYHEGNFISRDGIDKGMLTFHPSGFTHGPHPGAFSTANTKPRTHTDEVAVMIDTRQGLDVHHGLKSIENENYVNSWKGEYK